MAALPSAGFGAPVDLETHPNELLQLLDEAAQGITEGEPAAPTKLGGGGDTSRSEASRGGKKISGLSKVP